MVSTNPSPQLHTVFYNKSNCNVLLQAEFKTPSSLAFVNFFYARSAIPSWVCLGLSFIIGSGDLKLPKPNLADKEIVFNTKSSYVVDIKRKMNATIESKTELIASILNGVSNERTSLRRTLLRRILL